MVIRGGGGGGGDFIIQRIYVAVNFLFQVIFVFPLFQIH